MNPADEIEQYKAQTREIKHYAGAPADEVNILGPLSHLPGTWRSLNGRGWNMIALPFASAPSPLDYRLLMNQFNEKLVFDNIDGPIPNRGVINKAAGQTTLANDQSLAALDYTQTINQIAAEDFPVSGLAGIKGAPIHHEPGLLLFMLDNAEPGLNVARLGTIPHGDSLLAIGFGETHDGAPSIPDIDGLPIGVNQDFETSGYLAPYKHFNDSLFRGLFTPIRPNDLLKAALQGRNITRHTQIHLDTKLATGGIVNIPFIVKQANATEMTFTMWISELDELDCKGNPKLLLQYSQTVFLDFVSATSFL